MRIAVNGAWQEVAAADLAAVVAELGYGDARVATALDGDFVPARRRAETPLRNGSAVEIVAPMSGG